LAAPYSPLSTPELRQHFVHEAGQVLLRPTPKALHPSVELRTANKDLAPNLVVGQRVARGPVERGQKEEEDGTAR
jgi:hypothetical protein